MSMDLASIDLFDVFYVGYKSSTWQVRGFGLARPASKQAVPQQKSTPKLQRLSSEPVRNEI